MQWFFISENPWRQHYKRQHLLKRPLHLTCVEIDCSHCLFPGCLEVRSWFHQSKHQVIWLCLDAWTARLLNHFFWMNCLGQVTSLSGQSRHQRLPHWPVQKCSLVWRWDECHTAGLGQDSSHSWNTVCRYTYNTKREQKCKTTFPITVIFHSFRILVIRFCLPSRYFRGIKRDGNNLMISHIPYSFQSNKFSLIHFA